MRLPGWLVQLSVRGNSLTCGPKGYSICARTYEARLQGKRWGKLGVKVIDKLFWFDSYHCRKAWLTRQKKRFK